MLKLKGRIRKFEKALIPESEVEEYYVILNSRPHDIFFNQFIICKGKPTSTDLGMMKNNQFFGPYVSLTEARNEVLDHYQQNFPEKYEAALKRWSRKELIEKGFVCSSWTSFKLVLLSESFWLEEVNE